MKSKMGKRPTKEVPGFGIRIRLKDGSYRKLTRAEVDKMLPPGPNPETDFDGEQAIVDVLTGKPGPPDMSDAERRFRRSIRGEMKEAEKKGWSIDTPIG